MRRPRMWLSCPVSPGPHHEKLSFVTVEQDDGAVRTFLVCWWCGGFSPVER